MELKDTIEMMTSDDYKERFKAEYYQTKIRYNEARSKGYSRAESLVNGVIHRAANTATGGVVSVVEPRLRETKNQERIKKGVNKTKRVLFDE